MARRESYGSNKEVSFEVIPKSPSNDHIKASWRIKSTNPVYSGEAPGEEDTGDQSFLKRHDKFEKEEKQRKR